MFISLPWGIFGDVFSCLVIGQVVGDPPGVDEHGVEEFGAADVLGDGGGEGAAAVLGVPRVRVGTLVVDEWFPFALLKEVFDLGHVHLEVAVLVG